MNRCVPVRADPDPHLLFALRVLAERPELSQRELSAALGLSLGKTHYVLHALLDKGLVKARNFRRSDNKLAYAYLLTPAGVRAKLQLTRRFLARKEAEFEELRRAIALLRSEVGAQSQSSKSPS
jgi:EPS-associated MarR family transcriptional regulator